MKEMAMKGQPIETAPKDGSWLLVYCPSGANSHNDDPPLFVTTSRFDADAGGWYHHYADGVGHYLKPTMWASIYAPMTAA